MPSPPPPPPPPLLSPQRRNSKLVIISCRPRPLATLALVLPFVLSLWAFVMLRQHQRAIQVVQRLPHLLLDDRPILPVSAPTRNLTLSFDWKYDDSPDRLARAWRYAQSSDGTLLPGWIHEYFDWHREQRKLLTAGNYKSFKFLVLRCIEEDAKCGGISDRLKPLPLLLLEAKQTQRLLFIYWSRPCLLEEFLLPNVLDWRLPSWMVPLLPNSRYAFNTYRLHNMARSAKPIVSVKLQDQHGGSNIYNAQQPDEERAYRKHYGMLFRLLFEPAPRVQLSLSQQRRALQLADQNATYVAAHLRANYGKHPLPASMLRSVSINAVKCASMLQANVPVLFAADTAIPAYHVAMFANQTSRTDLIRPLVRSREPLHLDRAYQVDPNAYVDIFVDLFLLAQASCVAHGQGGFGRLGSLLSRNASCFMSYFVESRFRQCEWSGSH